MPVAQFDPFEFAALQPAGEAFQPPVEFGATSGQPFFGACRQAQLGAIAGTAATGSR